MNKKSYTYIFVIFITSLFFSGKGMAQDEWSLERCVNYAIENNITLKQQKLTVNYNKNQLQQAMLDVAPSVNSSAGYNLNFGRYTGIDNTFVNESSQALSFSASIDVTVFNGLTKMNTIKKRKIELETAMQDLEKVKDDISLSVMSAYLEILFNKELVNVTKEQLVVTNLQIEHNAQMVEAGSLAKGKLLETKAQKADEELTLTNYENELNLSLLNLMQLLDLEVNDNFDIVTPIFDTAMLAAELTSSNSVYSKAVTERPEILSKELMVKQAQYDIKIAEAQRYPYLSAFGSYNNGYNNKYTYHSGELIGTKIPFKDQIDVNEQKVLGLSLRIPIFNGYTVETNIKNSRISFENSKYELLLAKNNLQKEIQQVNHNAVAAMKRFYSSKQAVESTEEAFRYVEEKFKLGIVTPLEYNEAKNKVTNAQSSFIQAKYEYIFRIKILDFYLGKEIVL